MDDYIPIQIVLYKSISKLPNLIKSINLQDYSNRKIKVYFINNFPDDSLEVIVRSNPNFDYAYIDNPLGNVGFGRSHNYLFNTYIKDIKSKYFIISNADVIWFPSMLKGLIQDGNDNDKSMIVEPSQFPIEHSQVFDLQTKEKYWSTAACILLRSRYFEEVGGFDENLFMYCEDLDLSYKAILHGYVCMYSPLNRVVHITQHFDPNKDLSTEYYYSRLGTLYILKKYFDQKDVDNYIKYNISNLDERVQKRIINDFENIKTYDLSIKTKLPNPRIKIFDNFNFSPKRWEI